MQSWYKAGWAALLVCVLLTIACNDVYRPIVTPIPLPGGDPGSVDFVAVLSKNPAGTQDIVTFIDVSGDTNIGNRLVGPGAAWLGWDGTKSTLMVPNSTQDTVSQVAVSSTAIPTASLFPGSNPVYTFSRNTQNTYVLNRGTNSACPSSGSIGVLLTSNNSLQRNICVGPHPDYFTQTFDGVRLIVLDDVENSVRIINVNTQVQEANLTVGSDPVWAVVSTDNDTAYIVNKGTSDITVIDIPSGTVRNASIPTNGTSPVFAALDAHLLRLYVSNQGSNSVSVFDISRVTPSQLHAPVSVGPTPGPLTVLTDGSAAFVANTAANFITRIDGSSFATLPITVSSTAGATVTWIASPIAGTKVYASVVEPTNLSNGTAIVRVVDNVVVTTIPAPQQDLNCSASATVTCPQMRPTLLASRQSQ